MPDINVLKGLMGKVGQGQPISQVVQSASGALSGVGAMFGGAAGGAVQHKQPPAGANGVARTHKALFMSILSHALEKAHDSPHFNLDSAVTEVTQRLGHIRASKADVDKLHQMLSNNAGMVEQLEQLLKTAGASAKQVVQHLKV